MIPITYSNQFNTTSQHQRFFITAFISSINLRFSCGTQSNMMNLKKPCFDSLSGDFMLLYHADDVDELTEVLDLFVSTLDIAIDWDHCVKYLLEQQSMEKLLQLYLDDNINKYTKQIISLSQCSSLLSVMHQLVWHLSKVNDSILLSLSDRSNPLYASVKLYFTNAVHGIHWTSSLSKLSKSLERQLKKINPPVYELVQSAPSYGFSSLHKQLVETIAPIRVSMHPDNKIIGPNVPETASNNNNDAPKVNSNSNNNSSSNNNNTDAPKVNSNSNNNSSNNNNKNDAPKVNSNNSNDTTRIVKVDLDFPKKQPIDPANNKQTEESVRERINWQHHCETVAERDPKKSRLLFNELDGIGATEMDVIRFCRDRCRVSIRSWKVRHDYKDDPIDITIVFASENDASEVMSKKHEWWNPDCVQHPNYVPICKFGANCKYGIKCVAIH